MAPTEHLLPLLIARKPPFRSRPTPVVRARVGASRATYEHDGRSGDIDLMLWPVNFTLACVGYDVLAPFVAYGVEAGLRYSDPAAIEERLKTIVADSRALLPRLGQRATIPFNRMAEWGADGRIAPGAPVYSPFVRRKPRLELE